MRTVPPGQACFSAALAAAAVAFASPSLSWPAAGPAAAPVAAVRLSRTAEQQALTGAQVTAFYREPHHVAPVPSVPAPRISDDLESAALIPQATAQPSPQTPSAPSEAPQPSQEPPAAPVATYSDLPSASGAYGSFQACVIARESGGSSQVMNASGHYGLYQFSYSTWVAHGGSPADFGHASVAEQDQVFASTVAADGYSDWAPYDGC